MVLLTKLKKEKGMTLKLLAEASGVERFAISNIENKKYCRVTKNLKKLADYFGVENPLDLLKSCEKLIKSKKCLNQRCLLNKECYCQSQKVVDGFYCQNQNETSTKGVNMRSKNTNTLFIG